MSNVYGVVTSCLVNSVWEIPLVGGVGWVVARLTRRLGSRVEHVVWVSTLALAILTPVLPALRWLMMSLFASRGTHEASSIFFAAAQQSGTYGSGVFVIPAQLLTLLLAAYVGSLLYFVVRLGWSLYWTAGLQRCSYPVSLDGEREAVWHRCQRAFGFDGAGIVCSSRVTGPVTMGARRPVLIVPVGFIEECGPEDFLAAVAHECAHMRRRDFEKNLLYEFASLMIAFHPVTWMLKAQIAQTREMVCDEMATDALIETHHYTQSLLRLAAMIAVSPRASVTHAIGIFDANILEKRIMTIRNRKQQVGSVVKYGVMSLAALFLLSAGLSAAALAVVVEPGVSTQTANATKVDGQVYRIGNGVSAPVLTSQVDADFPKSYLKTKSNVDGSVIIALVVDASGVPRNVHVTRSFNPDFNANAIHAVEQYQRFAPAKRLGKPVAVSMNVEVNFKRY